MAGEAGAIPVPNPAMDLQQWVNLFGSLFGMNGSSTVDSTSPEGLSAGMSILPMILQMITSGDYSPEAATKDSQPAVQLLLQQALENGLPNISGAENSSGGYDSTTAALLKNDLQARAGAEGAALIAKNKATYGALRNGQTNSLIALINAISNASRRTTTNTQTPNLASNPAARNAALGAAAAGALGKAIKPSVIPPRKKPPQQPLLDPASVDELPQELLPFISPQGEVPDIQNIDDLPDSGPTPEVTVTNTGNTDTPGGDLGNDLAPDFGGLDLFDLGNPDFNFGDPGTGDGTDSPDWNFDDSGAGDPFDPGSDGGDYIDLSGTQAAEEGY